jgi:hypothetical protein
MQRHEQASDPFGMGIAFSLPSILLDIPFGQIRYDD